MRWTREGNGWELRHGRREERRCNAVCIYKRGITEEQALSEMKYTKLYLWFLVYDYIYCRYCILFVLHLLARPRKFQKYYIFFVGQQKHIDWRGATRLGIGALKVPFLVKLTIMPLVKLGLTEIQTRSKSPQNGIFYAFTSNERHSKIFVKFDPVWPILTRC